MGLKGVIVLEGANATGKSVLAKELERRYGAVTMHQTYRFRNRIFDFHTAVLHRALKLAETRLVVLDRLWMSEEVYAHVYRGGTPWPHQGRMVDRVLKKLCAITIVCLSFEDGPLRERYLQTRAHRADTGVEKTLAVNNRFRQLHRRSAEFEGRKTYFDDLVMAGPAYSPWSDILFYEIGHQYDNLCECLESMIQIRQLNQLPGARENYNFLGNLLTARYVLVGERLNPKFKWAWPFYEYGNSSLWLTEQLHALNFDESQAVWTNAYDQPQTILQLKAEGHLDGAGALKVVALGKSALRELERLQVPVHVEIPHPQFGRRFQHNGDCYTKRLRETLQPKD